MPDSNLPSFGRLLLLCAAAIPIFVGFALPFAKPGATGFALAAALVLAGAGLLWWVERHTRAALESDTALNRSLKSEGENLIGPDR